MKELNDFDDKSFRKIGKESTDLEIVNMLLNGDLKLEDTIYLGLPMKRMKAIANILRQTCNYE